MRMLLKQELDIIQSPLNYTGGKYKLLSSILPLFPKKIDTFIDLFCGGGNVGINIKAEKIILNDINSDLINLLKTFKNLKLDIFSLINEIIKKYDLSESPKHDYKYYNANQKSSLANYNKEKYLKLRSDFNLLTEKDNYYYTMLYVLIVFSFNNQIRFNKKGEFNLPVGKRDFNNKIKNKLQDFITRLSKRNFIFSNLDFRNFNFLKLAKNSFIYIDPPYLITCASYNEKNGWNVNDEKDLLNFIDKLNENNIRFALSNVMKNKNKENNILINWINSNKNKYKVINLNYDYKNSNYQIKNKTTKTQEVLIINY